MHNCCLHPTPAPFHTLTPSQRIEVPEVLYEEVVEVEERVVLAQDSCQLQLTTPTVTGTTGEKVQTML